MRSRKHAPTAAAQPTFALIRVRAPRPLHSPPCPAPRHALSARARSFAWRTCDRCAFVPSPGRASLPLSHCDRPATVAVASGTFDSARWLACFYAAASANANANACFVRARVACCRVVRRVLSDTGRLPTREHDSASNRAEGATRLTGRIVVRPYVVVRTRSRQRARPCVGCVSVRWRQQACVLDTRRWWRFCGSCCRNVRRASMQHANILIQSGWRQVVAVLDWELSTLGHPYIDLAYLVA